MHLIEYLNQIPDFRRQEGRRYPLSMVLLLSIMSIICGYCRYREMASFCRANQEEFVALFGLKRQQLPSHVTFREILKNVDFESLNQSFEHWAKGYVPVESGNWFSVDGKALSSTMSEYSSAYQNFVSLVSVFAHQRQQVLKVAQFENQKTSEIPIIQTLIQTLDLKGVVLTLDALHCQKKQLEQSSTMATIISSKLRKIS